MTAPRHTGFEELAAGYALNALDPADERQFLRHAAECPQCQQVVARFAEVAAALADAAPFAEPSPELGQRIAAMTAAGPDSGGADGVRPDGARPGGPALRLATRPRPAVPARPRRWQRWAAAAAAVAAIAAGGTWAGLAASSGSSPSPLTACATPHACPQVPLVAAATHREAAKVIVLGREVWMQPVAMASAPAGRVYVLWQITAAQQPRAVGSFSVRAGAHGPIKVGNLPGPYAGTASFAVSVEHAHQIPARPSAVIATGRVS